METVLYMVRHADSPFVLGEEAVRGLSKEGHDAARKVADVLADVDIAVIASSSYARAVQTVQVLAERKKLPVIPYEELIERPIKGPDYEASWEVLEQAVKRSYEDPDYALEGGESTRQAQQRAVPAVERLLNDYRGQNIVLGTHGNIMTIIMNHYDARYGYSFWQSTSRPDIYKMTFTVNRLRDIERIWTT